jgi:hypothetical protein
MNILAVAARSSERSIRSPRLETVQIRLPVDLMRWIDEFRSTMKIVPSRSEALRYLIERGKAVETDTSSRTGVK